MAVLVLDKRKHLLMPCTEKRARLLLERGRAVVVRMHPFTIRLKDRIGGAVQPLVLKLDPGSRRTGMALSRLGADGTQHVLWLFGIEHRGAAIRAALTQRRGFRRRRRNQLRHRAPRFDNRRRNRGWLPPSLRHRVDTTLSWVSRLRRLAPISEVAFEQVRFDTQQMQNPEIAGVEYQRGTLFGFEVWEYLLEKWNRTCAYCGARNVPLEKDHIHPRALGGSDRVSNLTVSCRPCNQHKGRQPVEAFLADRPERLQRILAQAKAPLRDAAAVNSTRHALLAALRDTGLPVTTGSGGRTKWNRTRLDIPKTHALDAACVGEVDTVQNWNLPVLVIRCTGRGSYRRTRLTRHGFPRGILMRQKRVQGFATGDHVRAVVPTGKHAGVHTGRVAVRATGSFNIKTNQGVVQGIPARHCTRLQRADGYGYSIQPKPMEDGRGSRDRAAHDALSLPGMNAGVSRAKR